MPVVLVHGISSGANQNSLKQLRFRLMGAVASVPELHLIESQVSVFFPSDLFREGSGEEIIIFVKGLFDQAERTAAVRNWLAENLVEAFCRQLSVSPSMGQPHLVECLVEPFTTDRGFYSRTLLQRVIGASQK